MSTEQPQRTSLGHIPAERWQFDESVTAVFSDMLERSIPQYHAMRHCVLELGVNLVKPGAAIVDLGCSTGDGLAQFMYRLGERQYYLGVDTSLPMLRAARERFKREIEEGFVRIDECDLRKDYPNTEAGLTLCVLTLQFTPLEARKRILHQAYSQTEPGGLIILVEKVRALSESIDSQMIETYHKLKVAAGYSVEEVERKRLALQGVLVPMTAVDNERMVMEAGFKDVECFWRWMNFGGWVARK